jgi:predicted MPP superfamily phosphohydrolase
MGPAPTHPAPRTPDLPAQGAKDHAPALPGLAKAGRHWVRPAFFWGGLWALFVAVSTFLHWALWIAPRHSPPIDTFQNMMWLRLASNVSTTLAAPGWIVTTRIIGRLFPLDLGITIVSTGLAWAFWLGMVFAALRLRTRLIGRHNRLHPDHPADPSRRRLLVNSVYAGTGFAAGGTLTYAALVEPFDLRLLRHELAIADWPEQLNGLRTVFISDTHLGPRVPAEHIRRAYQMAAELKPDLILLGGDYVHNGQRFIAPAAELLKHLPIAGTPTLGVLGNHDWYADGPLSKRALEQSGVCVIDNTRLFLDASTRRLSSTPPPGPHICIAGVGDAWEDSPDFAAALDGVAPGTPRIVLSHQPDTAESDFLKARKPRIDLMLCGHTHGGQVRLPFLGSLIVPSRFGRKYAYGLVQGPLFPVLISSGVGMSIVPLRINMPPEIVEITFRRA